MTQRALLFIFLTLCFAGPNPGLSTTVTGGEQTDNDGASPHSEIRVLFIGNSLTYTNDLPGTLSNLVAGGGWQLYCASVTRPGYALIDHLDGGSNAVDVIRQGGWDYVILQQGPSSLPESRVLLIEGTVRFDEEIHAVGAITSLYMVWPDRSRYSYFEAVRQNYKAAADTVGGLFLPAGEAWLTAWGYDPTIPLYGADDFHPSPLGTYLAALVIYEEVTGGDARDLPDEAVVAGNTLDVPGETIELLQSAAHATNARYIVTGIDDSHSPRATPLMFDLGQNYPNPFNPVTTIRYGIPAAGHVTVVIYNVLGQEIATLVDGAQEAGYQTVSFDARGLPSGFYTYRITAGTFTTARKMLLLK